jgi:hypothetical protein
LLIKVIGLERARRFGVTFKVSLLKQETLFQQQKGLGCSDYGQNFVRLWSTFKSLGIVLSKDSYGTEIEDTSVWRLKFTELFCARIMVIVFIGTLLMAPCYQVRLSGRNLRSSSPRVEA